MGNSCINQLCFLIFLASIAIAFASHSNNSDHHLSSKPKVALFVFGDSIFDPGNNNYINTTPDFEANFLPYGETFFEFGTGRFSNGRLIPDFIAKYAKLPLIPPYFQSSYRQFVNGVNFASGGGGALVETHEGKVIDVNKQLSYFKNVEKQMRRKLGNNETDQLLSNAVYIFSIGGNDLLAPSPKFSSFSSQEYIEIIVGNFTAVLKEIYKAGGRKFGYLTVVPLGCLPYARAQNAGANGETCVKDKNDLVKLCNVALTQKFRQLEKQLKGFIYSKFDLFTAVIQRTSNPSKYDIYMCVCVKVSRKGRLDAVAAGLIGELITPVEGKDLISQSMNYVIILGNIYFLTLIIQLKERTSNSRSLCGMDIPVVQGPVVSSHSLSLMTS